MIAQVPIHFAMIQCLSPTLWAACQRFLWLWLSYTVLGIHAGAVTTPQNHFVSPAVSGAYEDYRGNSNYTLGQELDLQWVTNFTSLAMVLYQDRNSTGTMIFQNQYPVPTSYKWTVALPEFDLNEGTGKVLSRAGLDTWLTSV